MARIISIHKTGNTTVLKLIEDTDQPEVFEIFSYNKPTDIRKGLGETIVIEASGKYPQMIFKVEELEEFGIVSTAEEWLEYAASNFFFAYPESVVDDGGGGSAGSLSAVLAVGNQDPARGAIARFFAFFLQGDIANILMGENQISLGNFANKLIAKFNGGSIFRLGPSSFINDSTLTQPYVSGVAEIHREIVYRPTQGITNFTYAHFGQFLIFSKDDNQQYGLGSNAEVGSSIEGIKTVNDGGLTVFVGSAGLFLNGVEGPTSVTVPKDKSFKCRQVSAGSWILNWMN